MDWTMSLLLILGPFFFLLALGVPVAFSLFTAMLIGSLSLIGTASGPFMTITSLFDSLADFSLVPVPLFTLMGTILLKSGIAIKGINALSMLLGNLPARMSLLANLGGALFGLLSGSTMASTAVVGNTLAPEMRKRGYSKKMTYGPILASGGLAMIIPPSTLAVIYGSVAEVSVGHLLLAGLLPGIVMTINYIVNIMLRVKLNPDLVPKYQVPEISLKEKIKVLFVDLVPFALLVFLVTGVFVLGIATPTESAALGALGSILLAFVYKKLDYKIMKEVLSSTLTITAMTLLIAGTSMIFSQLLAYSGATRAIIGLVTGSGLPEMLILFLMLFVVLILGSFMESVPIMMITLPLYTPILINLGVDRIWFGVIMLITLQVGLTTPPFGLLLFIMKGVAKGDAKMRDLYGSAYPFIISDLITILLIVVFPAIVRWLPRILFN